MNAFARTLAIAVCSTGALLVPARATAQADQTQLQVLTNVSVPSVTSLGTASPLAVTNRGKVNGGTNIVYVGGTVPSGSNTSYCLNVVLSAAFPPSQDIMARRFDGTYVALGVGLGEVTVAKRAGAGTYSDPVSYRMTSKAQLSDADATSLRNYLTYSTVQPCP
jgi:hypothetical protein